MAGLDLAQLHPLHGRSRDAKAALASPRGPKGYWVRLGALSWLEDGDQGVLFPDDVQALRERVEAQLAGQELYVTVHGVRGDSYENSDVRRLNCVPLDLDGHKLGLTPGQLFDAIHEELREGNLPPWSLLIYSGRGLWVVWMLRGESTGWDDLTPPEASNENAATYKAVLSQLTARYAHLGADPKSTNLGRLCRVPGSLNAAAGERVTWYYAAHGDQGLMPAYTLEQFAQDAGLDLEAVPGKAPRNVPGKGPARQRAKERWKPRKKPRGRGRQFDTASAKKAAQKRYSGPLDEVLALIRSRDGLHEGHREDGLWTFGHVAASAGWTLERTLAEAKALRLRPALPLRRAQDQARNGWKMGTEATAPLKFTTIAERLELSHEEAERLGLTFLARGLPKQDTRLDAFVAAWKALERSARKQPTLRAVREQLAELGHRSRSGKPLSLETLGRLRDKASAARLIPREVRRRSPKDRQLRLAVSNAAPSTPDQAAPQAG